MVIENCAPDMGRRFSFLFQGGREEARKKRNQKKEKAKEI